MRIGVQTSWSRACVEVCFCDRVFSCVLLRLCLSVSVRLRVRSMCVLQFRVVSCPCRVMLMSYDAETGRVESSWVELCQRCRDITCCYLFVFLNLCVREK